LSWAQDASQDSIDPDAWTALVSRAEDALDAGRASDAALESLRSDIATYRQRFGDARDDNAARIRNLQSQITALGPEPEDGDEIESVATARAQLEARLEELRAPSVVAEAAFSEANGLVSEIDAVLRARSAERIFSRGPVPINPAFWPTAMRELTAFFDGMVFEIENALNNEVTRARAASSIPLASFLTVLGLVCILRGRRMAGRLGDQLRKLGGRGSGVWAFLVSLGRIFIPLIGVLLILVAIRSLDLAGIRGNTMIGGVMYCAIILLSFGWLGERVCDLREDDGLMPEGGKGRAQIRASVWALALVLVVEEAAKLIISLDRIDEASAAVIYYPIIVISGIVLFRVIMVSRVDSRLIESQASGGEEGEDGEAEKVPPTKAGLLRMLSPVRIAAQIVAVAAPLAATAGYTNAAMATLFPMIWTLAIVALAAVLQRFLANVYGWATGQGAAALDSLFSVLTGFLLTALSLPFIALTWGVRDSDLSELWSRFLEGVTIGGTRISPVDFLTFLVIFGLGYGATRLIQSALKTGLLPKTRLDIGGQNAIVSGTGYVGIFLAALIAVTSAGINLSSVAIVAGALSVGIGFGLQTIVSNFVSGIILLVERPVSEGDWIEVGGTMGIVKHISVRATRIETFDRTDVIVPNSDLISGMVTNYTHTPTGRVIIAVGVAYGTDSKRVERILQEVAEDHPMVLARPAPFVVFQGFGADALDFEVRVIIRDVSWGLSVRTDLNHAIAERFAAEGIEIPFKQTDIWLRNPETLARHDTSDPNAQGGADPMPERQRELDADPDDAADNGPDTSTST
ncbi:MAG: DUF3772 domain-containing protein, partial [Pseudomonadota bacterium]